ncbi:hypothetical protein [Microcella alkalica]|uniref:Uncharacterized protein n=1 Tax=Microcella alkalica TaxID=355930 RepID=A0A839E4A1_9MICO|nr:hypothetical protein [Microcella alkalica]MBA8846620.1 hypothetical protein [Microcella alkalica]
MHGTVRHGSARHDGTRDHGVTDARERSRHRERPIAAALAVAGLAMLAGCAPSVADQQAPVFASTESRSDEAVTAACWRVANAMSLATNAQRGAAEGRWAEAEADGAYRAAARILNYIPVPSSSPVALPLIVLQELVDAPAAGESDPGLDPADPVWQRTVDRVMTTCIDEGVPVVIDEWTS